MLRLIGERLSLPVPRPCFVDPLRGVLAYPLLPGRPLLGQTPPAGAAAQLGRMLAELHAINPVDRPGLVDGPAAPRSCKSSTPSRSKRPTHGSGWPT